MGDRQQRAKMGLSVEARLSLLEQDGDEDARAIAGLRRVLIGLLISLASSSVLLAATIIVNGAHK